MPDISLMATLVATLLGFVLGALWYGPLFGKAWMAAAGLDAEVLRRNFNPAKTYGATFVLGFIGAYVFGLFLGPNPGRAFAAAAGAAAGVCWVAMSLATNDLFERRPLALTMINAGYHAVAFTMMGAIIGVWR